MKVKITIVEKNAAKQAKEKILEERIVVTESKKRLTADRARRILRREIAELNRWHYPGLPVITKKDNRWYVMRSTDEKDVWKYYYIQEVSEVVD